MLSFELAGVVNWHYSCGGGVVSTAWSETCWGIVY